MEIDPVLFVAWFVVFVFSTTLHEAAHAWAAQRLGDSTAYRGGQVSLNPVPHIRREPFGMVLMPILSFFLFGGGWMIGWASAPYNLQWALRYPQRSAVMAAAGPASNLLLVMLSFVGIRAGIASGYLTPRAVSFSEIVGGSAAAGSEAVATLLSVALVLNLVLFLFNLLPLPPLDGSAIVQLVMSRDVARRYQELMLSPMWNIVGLVAAWRLFSYVFTPIYSWVLGLLYAGV